MITITDDGSGMPSDVVHQIFEPFYTTARGRGGSGLGLYICYNLVTSRLDGTIECHSSLGNGTSFTIELPLKIDGGRLRERSEI